MIFGLLYKKDDVFMYITQEIANRIKQRAKSKRVSIKDMLSDCNMNINAISEFGKGKQLSCISLARIADFWNVRWTIFWAVRIIQRSTDSPNTFETSKKEKSWRRPPALFRGSGIIFRGFQKKLKKPDFAL
jgi:transcriptional regulator with XRE-family HTH domain